MSREKPAPGDVFYNPSGGNLFMLVDCYHSENNVDPNKVNENTLVYLMEHTNGKRSVGASIITTDKERYAVDPKHKFLFNISEFLVTHYEELTKHLKP